MLDRHARRRIRNRVTGVIGATLIRMWIGTLRVRLDGPFQLHGRVPLPVDDGIFVFWHRHMLMPAGAFRNSGFRCMISEHADGEMIARIIERLGMKALRGSTTRGGTKAVREALGQRADTTGLHILITPDGPRGPRDRFQPGAVWIASRTGLPVYPAAVTLERAWRLPSWDGFEIPRPFSRGLVRIGGPVSVPPDLDREAIDGYRRLLEERLRELNADTARGFDEHFARALPRSRLPAAVPAHAGLSRRSG